MTRKIIGIVLFFAIWFSTVNVHTATRLESIVTAFVRPVLFFEFSNGTLVSNGLSKATYRKIGLENAKVYTIVAGV